MGKALSLFLFRGINKQERQGIASKSKPDLNFSCNLYPGENIGTGCLGGWWAVLAVHSGFVG